MPKLSTSSRVIRANKPIVAAACASGFLALQDGCRIERDSNTNNMRSSSFDDRHLGNSATTASSMSRSFRSTVLKGLGGAALIALSFWLTLQGLDYFQSSWEQIRSNTILTFGDASSSAASLTDGVVLQFPGNGYVEIQNTKSLQCLKFKCRFSLAVDFGPTPAPHTQLIIGQSFYGEIGWHLIFDAGRLLLQADGGGNNTSAPFNPKPSQRYRIDINRTDQEVSLAVDNVVVAKSKEMPFTDTARDLSIGGRAGSIRLPLAGTVSEVQISRYRPPDG
jgi:hypothetical protein